VTVPQTIIPAAITIYYSQDSSGALVIPRGGSGIIQLANTGGQSGQWTMSSPAGYRLSATGGALSPGETLTITVTDTQKKDHAANINALVAPGDRFVIPLKTP
jgi:hypothetical protein